MKKFVTMLLAVVLALGCTGLVACGGNDDKNELHVCIASEPDTLDPALNSAVDGATMAIHLFSGLIKYDATGKLVADCAKELPTGTLNADGTTTYVFELRDGMKWSNGDALKASDFEYSWKRAASTALAADYGYMFDVIKGYGEDDVDGLAPLAVAADDTANTLTVTLNVDVPYFFELCAFPTYLPVHKATVANESWATSPETYVNNGAYTITKWDHDSQIILEKNENYFDADKITMEKIVFHLSDDAANMLANYKNGSWLFIDDVPTDEMAALNAAYGADADTADKNEYRVEGQLGTYYINFNINLDLLPADYTIPAGETRLSMNAKVKSALGLLIDRQYICDEIGQAGQLPASSFVAKGLTDADGNEFYLNANKAAGNDYVGYYDASAEAVVANAAAAVDFLKTIYAYDDATNKFTNFPRFTYLYNTNDGHKAIAEYFQQALAVYGIAIDCTNQEWNTFLDTRKNGDYGVARNGWLGDYNDPISFLDMWLTASGNNDVQFGKAPTADQLESGKYFDASACAEYSISCAELGGKYEGAEYNVTNGTWAETYDVLIGAIKTESDPTIRFALMHMAEDLLMSTGNILPVYYYTDIFMIDNSVSGFFSSPLGYKYFMYTTINK